MRKGEDRIVVVGVGVGVGVDVVVLVLGLVLAMVLPRRNTSEVPRTHSRVFVTCL